MESVCWANCSKKWNDRRKKKIAKQTGTQEEEARKIFTYNLTYSWETYNSARCDALAKKTSEDNEQ
jgi:predicted secreted protein